MNDKPKQLQTKEYVVILIFILWEYFAFSEFNGMWMFILAVLGLLIFLFTIGAMRPKVIQEKKG